MNTTVFGKASRKASVRKPIRPAASRVRSIPAAEIASGPEAGDTPEIGINDSERRLRLVLAASGIVVFQQDAELRYLWIANPGFGLRESEVLGRTDGEVFGEAEAEPLVEIKRRVLQSGITEAAEVCVSLGGRTGYYELVAQAERDAAGRIVGLLCAAKDITERKAIEAKLAETAHLLELALSGSEQGTWDTDIASRRSTYDERYCALLGYRTDEIEASMDGWLRLVHPDDRPNVDRTIRAHLEGESPIFEVEHRLRHKAGHWVWVLARGKVTYDAAGHPVRASGTHQDISNRKRLSEYGTDLLHRLEELVAGFTGSGRGGSAMRASSPAMRGGKRLSGRNREILELIAAGRTTAQMARELGIAESTAKTHRRNLMRKFDLKNQAELIRYAIKQGIAKP